jgi:hypothetical protein
MEKLKWIILGILMLVMVVVIFNTPDVNEEIVYENHAKITMTYSDVITREGKTNFINEGDYILFLDEFQIIEGYGSGWQMHFSRPFGDKTMIFIFDVVDTSGTIFNTDFPQEFVHSPTENKTPQWQIPLYRGSFKIGFKKQINDNSYFEDYIPMVEFSCKIDTSWAKDTTGGFLMSFYATHTALMHDVYGMKYNLKGVININNARLFRRELQRH